MLTEFSEEVAKVVVGHGDLWVLVVEEIQLNGEGLVDELARSLELIEYHCRVGGLSHEIRKVLGIRKGS